MDLLEREEELAHLADRSDRARGGQGGLVVVAGESGAGKSTLVQAFAEQCGDLPVLWGACDPLSTPRPLGPVHDLAAQLGGDVAEALATAGQSHEIYSAVFERLRVEPMVVAIEDLHWADQGTVDLLRYLLRRLRVTSSMVVGTVREDEIGTDHPLRVLLGDIARSPDADVIAVRPLSLAAVEALAGDRAIDAAWLHRLTGGNAFYVTEMLDHDDGELPRTVRDAILARTEGLDADAWDLLHLLACAPEAIPDPLLTPLGVGLPALREVDRAGLVRRGRRGVAFRHDLCRLALRDTLPPGGEVTFHRRMVDALSTLVVTDPAVLTHHALGAGDTALTLRSATAAGKAAARSGAHTQAAAFFQTALDHGGPIGVDEEATLLELMAEEYYLIDHLDPAIAASERAIELRQQGDDLAGVSFNHHALSVYQWYNARRDLAERHAALAQAVLDATTDLEPDQLSQLGHALSMQAYLAMQANDLDQARTLLEGAVAAASRVDDLALATRTRIIDGVCDVVAGKEGSREATLELLDLTDEELDVIYSSGYSNLTYLDVEQRRLGPASELMNFTLPMTIERDLPICRAWQLGSRGRMKLLGGDWDDAVADADLVLGGPSAPIARTWPHLVRGLAALRREGGGDADLEEAWVLAARYGEPIRMLPAAAAMVEASWLHERDDPRVDAAPALLASATGSGLDWARGELAVWLRRLGTAAAAAAVAALDLSTVAEPYRLQLSGRADEAAAAWGALSAPYDQALASIDHGTVESTRAGLDLLDRLGADHVAAKIRRDLRRGGRAAVPARRRATTRGNPAGLTNRQVEILTQLADGSTNAEIAERLFISPKTVDHHVSAILAKLQVPTRREAARRAAELDLSG